MPYIIGIDTGGTYTDAVMVDSKSRDIIHKIKTLTTKDDISIGIRNSIQALMIHAVDNIKLVSISTTMATNALVEDKGTKVGLIYTGFELEENVPASCICRVRGKVNIKGEVIEPINYEEVKQALIEMKDKVEGIAISGYASVKNPKQEQEIRDLAVKILKVPVVCGHQLTSALGIQQRTVTAVLNARLIPITDNLIKSVHTVMDEQKIDAPLMIVKGDGTLMSEKMALERPIDTILSGPAASVAGALALTGYENGIVIDMGGTTTDIAEVVKGRVRINNEGAKIGDWFTRVKAVDVHTIGLGGNSKIYLGQNGNLCVGPESVIPLCMAGADNPALFHEIQSFRRVGELKKYFSQEADCFTFIKESKIREPSEQNDKIINMLKERPHSISFIASQLGVDPEQLDLSELVKEGIIARISLTPTDLLHHMGKYKKWDYRFSTAAIDILAQRKGNEQNVFLNQAVNEIKKRMALACLESVSRYDDKELRFSDSRETMYLIMQAIGFAQSQFIDINIDIKKPIIAIGAPAEAWLTHLSQLFNAEVIVPPDADVANSYGAAVAQITEEVELVISKNKSTFVLNCPWDRTVYDNMDEAMFYAVHEGRKHIEHILQDYGCKRWDIEETSENCFLKIGPNESKTYLETKITIRGTGTLI